MRAVRDLADDLIRREGRDATPFGTYVVPGLHPAAELGRAVEREVFGEFFGNSPELLAEEYAAYEANSLFLLVLDHRLRTPAGVLRVLLPHGPLKSLDDIGRAWEEPADTVMGRTRNDFDRSKIWDVATLAAMPDYRGSSTSGLISLGLYQAVCMMSGQQGSEWLIAVLDLVVLDLIQTLTERPFERFAGLEPRSYLDSPSSLPVYIPMVEYRQRLALQNPDMHAILFSGTGLEAGLSTPDWASTPMEGAGPLRAVV